MLTDKETALLVTKLEAPLVVEDILSGKSRLSDDVQYGLHSLISDLGPDTALLAIATSAGRIASAYIQASPGMGLLAVDCARLIDAYGAQWLEKAAGQKSSETAIVELLADMAEDLEGLAELLGLNSCFLRAKDPQAAAIFDILKIQASAHALIAEEFAHTADHLSGGRVKKPVSSTVENIIPFPAQAVRA